jgi:hypothetical protein
LQIGAQSFEPCLHPVCILFVLKNLFSFFSDSNEERESHPPDKEEVPEKAGKMEPSFTKANSRFFSHIHYTLLPSAPDTEHTA